MSDKSSIEWTDATWNPIRGTTGRHHCVRISEGCKHCYAATMNHRFGGPDYVKGADTPRLDEDALLQPMKWKKPRRIFVCSMTDLFMDEHTDEMINRVFAVMALSPHHTFQVLTKRSKRMREHCNSMFFPRHVDDAKVEIMGGLRDQGRSADAYRGEEGSGYFEHGPFLSNVWLGVSAENQERADERIPDLLATPAAVRFVSAEPLLGPVDLHRYLRRWRRGDLNSYGAEILEDRAGLDWAIVGGESGPGARPCDVQWIRSIKDQCQAEGVAVFVKQLGGNVRDRNDVGFDADSHTWAEGEDAGKPVNPKAWPDIIAEDDRIQENPNGVREEYQGAPVRICLKDRKGGDPAEWPEDLRVRQMPEVRG